MADLKASPSDSRYVPLTQQPDCWVPTCIQMVMYKNDIPLIPAEEIGYHLGLIVHPDKTGLYYKVRTAEVPPPAGYGTQVYLPEYEPNIALRKLGIPLKFSKKLLLGIKTSEDLLNNLKAIEDKNGDALLCFNHGELIDNKSKNWGHVVVFDRVIDEQIRIIDPSPDKPKWRSVTAEKMFSAMRKHGEQKSAGIWLLEKLDS